MIVGDNMSKDEKVTKNPKEEVVAKEMKNTKDDVAVKETKNTKEEVVVKETTKKKKDVAELEEHNEIKRFGEIVFKKVFEYRYLIALELVVFVLLFFLIPQIIFSVPPYVWWTLFVIFTVVPTYAFYSRDKFIDYQILLAIPILYLLIMSVLQYSILNDLYGITNRELDRTPPWLDAMFVTFIIVFFQYLGMLIVKFKNRLQKGTA